MQARARTAALASDCGIGKGRLARAELSPAQEGEHILRRKEIWDRRNKTNNERNPSDIQRGPGRPKEFASELAAVTGDSKTQTNVKIARARELGPDIRSIVGTSLDKGVEMDALIKLPDAQRGRLPSATKTFAGRG